MKTNILIRAAIAGVIASQSYAGDIFFVQPGADTVGITTLVIDQIGGAVDQMGTTGAPNTIFGGLNSVTIKQLGSDTSYTSTNNGTATHAAGVNTADIQFYGDNTLLSNFSALFSGSSNDFDFTMGSATPTAYYTDVEYQLDVTGSGNRVADALEQGATGTATYVSDIDGNENTVILTTIALSNALTYNGKIEGNGNNVTIDVEGDVNSAVIHYEIDAATSNLNILMAGGTGGATTDNRSVNAGIGGGLTATGTSGVVDFTAGTPAANVTLNIDQYGNSVFDIDIVQEGTGDVAAYLTDATYSGCTNWSCMEVQGTTPTLWAARTQTGTVYNTTANVNVFTKGPATFRMAQNTADASYVGDITIATGGTANIQQ